MAVTAYCAMAVGRVFDDPRHKEIRANAARRDFEPFCRVRKILEGNRG
jgi:hypothetical protein